MRINHNIAALNTFRQLQTATNGTSKSMEKLSSGLRINKAGDDAAGLAISEKMRGQIRGLDQAGRNAQDGISLLQTAEGALNETHSILQRMRELATQAANDTNTSGDREEIQKEINQLTSEINRIGNTTEFNTKKLLNFGDGTSVTSASSSTVVDNVLKGLKEGGWLQAAEKQIEDMYGLTGQGSKIKVILEPGTPYGTLASVGGTTEMMELRIDLSDFNPATGENGSNSLGPGFYADRIIAHEMVHAVMNDEFGAAKTNAMQSWFKEGSAEFIHGADERLKNVIGNNTNSGIDATKLTNLINRADDLMHGEDDSNNPVTWRGDDQDYAAGYIIMKYVESTLAPGKDFKTLMADIKTSVASGDQAVKDAIVTNTGNTTFEEFILEFTNDANTYINNLTLNWGSDEVDTGSIKGNEHTGAVAINAEDIIDESSLTLDTDGQPLQHFQIVWPESDEIETFTSGVTLQIGANQGQSLTIQLQDMRANALNISGHAGADIRSKDGSVTAKYTEIDTKDASNGVTNGTNDKIVEYALDVSTHENATAAIEIFDDAIAKVSSFRSQLGAAQNRLEHTINNLSTSSENLTAAESRIRDVDMAKEMMEQTKQSILSQASQAMLAQANQAPQGVLQLLR